MNAPTEERSANDIARDFLFGEVLNAATKQLRALDKPWLKLPKEAQEKVLRAVKDDVGESVKRAVEIIATDDRTRFRATVESVTFKDGVKAVLTMGNTAASHELADTAGGTVLVVVEDPARYTYPGDNAPKSDDEQQTLV
jgi:hypothetical protein